MFWFFLVPIPLPDFSLLANFKLCFEEYSAVAVFFQRCHLRDESRLWDLLLGMDALCHASSEEPQASASLLSAGFLNCSTWRGSMHSQCRLHALCYDAFLPLERWLAAVLARYSPVYRRHLVFLLMVKTVVTCCSPWQMLCSWIE